MLAQVFRGLVLKSTGDEALMRELWQEIVLAYSGPQRYYHNLLHLENLFRELDRCEKRIRDQDALLYALFYHDIVYDVCGRTMKPGVPEWPGKGWQPFM